MDAEPTRTKAYAPDLPDPISELADRSRRLAQVVESSSRRRDCREFRARLLILILENSCPLGARPNRSWYVPGAAARLGPEGLRRAWSKRFGEEPRSLRSFRAHLGSLENALAIVRSPGDWMPRLVDQAHPERRPRYPDTIHVLDDERAALWWEGEGDRMRRERPETRHNPTAWREVFAGWREWAAREDLDLVQLAERGPSRSPEAGPELLGDVLASFTGTGKPQKPAEPARSRAKARDAARSIVQSLAAAVPAWALVRTLELAGAGLRGRARARALADPERLNGAAAMFAIALLRDDGGPRHRIRSRAGWIVRAFDKAPADELREALARVKREGGAS